MKTQPDAERSTVKATSKSAPRKSARPAGSKSAAKKDAGAKKSASRGAASKGAANRKPAGKTAAKKASAKSGSTFVAKTPRAKPAAPVDKGPQGLAPVVATLRHSVLSALEEMKAKDIKEIDIRGKASFADLLFIASGTSTRHVKSLADEVVKFVKKAGMMPLGVEGQKEAEWVLVDLGDIVCHIMLPRIREFYALERLWSVGGDDETTGTD